MSDSSFLKLHARCIYCSSLATTIDHQPPRALFRDRTWPEEFRFPSCFECNSQSRLDDQVVASLARMRLFDDPVADAATIRLLHGVKNNTPEIMREWMSGPSRNETRRWFRERFGEKQGDALRNSGLAIINYGDKTRGVLDRFCRKLMQALFFRHLGLSADGRVFAKAQSMIDHKEAMDKAIALAPLLQLTARNNVDLSDQFAYRYGVNESDGALFVVAKIGDQLGILGHAFSARFWDNIRYEEGGQSLIEHFYSL